MKVTIRASGNYDKLVFQLDDHPALVVPMVEKQRSNKRADVKDKTEETSVIERTFFIPIEHEYGHHRPKEIEVQGFVWHRTANERKFDVVARKRARLKYPKNIKAKTAAR